MAVTKDTSSEPQISLGDKTWKMYSKYFPTDKESFPARFAIIGVIVSLLLLQMLFFCVFWLRNSDHFIVPFYVIIAAVHYGLFKALETGNLRLVSPWLFWKVFEIIYTIWLLIIWRRTGFRLEYSILAFFSIAIDILMLFCLYKHLVEASEVRNFQVESDSKKSTPNV